LEEEYYVNPLTCRCGGFERKFYGDEFNVINEYGVKVMMKVSCIG